MRKHKRSRRHARSHCSKAGWARSRTRLYKVPSKGAFLGVCAGFADYFGVRVGAVRFLTVIGALVTGGWMVLFAYIALAMILDPKPEDLYQDEDEETFWKQTRKAPDYSAAEIRRRFRDLEKRTVGLEAFMTSKRFRLERELKALED